MNLLLQREPAPTAQRTCVPVLHELALLQPLPMPMPVSVVAVANGYTR